MADIIDPKRLMPSNLKSKIILVRGAPGSGKTLFSNQISQMIDADYYNVLSVAADDFFYDEAGNYNFDKTKLPNAHYYCQMMVDKYLNNSNLPSIIFVHGSGLSHITWVLQTRYFAFHGYSVLAIDLPGHGYSEGPSLKSMEEMGDWIVDIINS